MDNQNIDKYNQTVNPINQNLQESNVNQEIISIKSKSESSQSVKAEDLISSYSKDGNKVYTVLA